MRILIVTHLFKPEMGALASRLYPLVGEMVERGHEVYVASGMPNYPTGKIYPGYQGKWKVEETIDRAKVFRTWYIIVPRNKSKLGMLMHYLSFMLAGYLSGRRAPKPDVVYVTSPPLFAVPPALWLHRRAKKSKLVFELRDLWPDELVSVGAAKEGSFIVRFLRKIERTGYKRADLVPCVTHSFIDVAIERGVPADRTFFAPNGADVETFRPLPSQNHVSETLGLEGKFVVLYSGMLGLKYGLETLLDVAEKLQDDPEVVLFIRGAGPMSDELPQLAAQRGLKNVRFGQEVPFEHVPYILARADVCVTCLPPDEYLERIISVKTFEYMACEKPVVAALAGEGARVVNNAKGGIVVPPGDVQGMADGIRRLKADPALRKELGENGRRHVVAHYSRRDTSRRLIERLEQLAGDQPRRRVASDEVRESPAT